MPYFDWNGHQLFYREQGKALCSWYYPATPLLQPVMKASWLTSATAFMPCHLTFWVRAGLNESQYGRIIGGSKGRIKHGHLLSSLDIMTASPWAQAEGLS
jgi:hypothetical protein